MATQTENPNDHIQRSVETNGEGKTYRYGASNIEHQDLRVNSKSHGSTAVIIDQDVTWPVTGDVWKDVNVANVIRYSLHADHGSAIFDWEFEFNTQTAGKYRFWDSENPKDYYDCKVFIAGDHKVRFNSKVSTISKVQYWSD